MEKLIIHRESCKGCQYCIANCPKSALTMTGPINSAGYMTTEVDGDKCITCGICYNVCPDYVYEILEEEAKA